MTKKNEIFAEGYSLFSAGNLSMLLKSEDGHKYDYPEGESKKNQESIPKTEEHEHRLPRQALRVIQKIKEYIEQNPLYEKNAADFAEELNVSRRLLLKWFKEAEGVGIKQYSEGQRLEVCKKMLEEGEKSVKEITRLCKYKSQAYFTRVFKKKYGIAPSKWKQKFS